MAIAPTYIIINNIAKYYILFIIKIFVLFKKHNIKKKIEFILFFDNKTIKAVIISKKHNKLIKYILVIIK